MHTSQEPGAEITSLERRLALAPDDPHLVLDLASLLLRSGQPTRALALTKQFIHQSPLTSAPHRRWLTQSGLCDWPAYRAAPSHAAHSQALAIRRPPSVRWTWTPRQPHQALCCAPVAAQGIALIVHTDQDTLGGFDPSPAHLTCIDLHNGSLRWVQKRTCFPACPVIDPSTRLALWSWLARDDQGRTIPEFVGIHIDSGEVAWFTRGDPIHGYSPYDASPLLLSHGRLIAASNGYRPGFRPDGGFLCVLDARSGQLHEQLALSGARTPAVNPRGDILFYNDDEHFYILPIDAISPKRLGHDPLSASLNISPIIVGDAHSAWVLSEGERGANLWHLDNGRRHPLWQLGADGSFAHAPCLDAARDLLFVASSVSQARGDALLCEGHLLALDARSGEPQQRRVDPWRPLSSPVLVEDVLYVCGELSQRPVIGVVGALGEQLPPDLIGQVSLEEGRDYFQPLTTQRSLSAFDTRNGLEPLWRLPLPDHLSATIEPVPVGDMLLVQYGAGNVAALSDSA
jgi:hypothetical protein